MGVHRGVQDKDEPGRKHARQVYDSFQGVAQSVRIVEAKNGKDAAEHLGSGLSVEDFVEVDPVTAPETIVDEEAPGSPRARLIRLADVKSKQVRWLWPGLIPLGKVTVLDGDPGLGKSTAMLDIAARVTTGRSMPDGSPGVEGSVILLSAEDDPSDTIRPRLEAARADLSRVHLLSAIQTPEGDRLPELPLDLPYLEEAISQNVAPLASLVVIDPLMAFLGGDVNSHRDQDVRRALAPLKKLAEDTCVAVVIVRHLNKAIGGDPLYRGGGSIGIIGAARSGLLIAKDPEDENRRVLAMTKSNLAALTPALSFRIVEDSGAIALDWLGTTTHTAASLLAAPQDEEERSQLGEAKEFLAQELSDGRVPADEIGKLARKAAISERTLKRAKAALGVESKKEGFEGIWYWSLPEKMRREPRGPSSMPWGSGPLRGETAAEGVRADHPSDLGPLREPLSAGKEGNSHDPDLLVDAVGEDIHQGRDGERQLPLEEGEL